MWDEIISMAMNNGLWAVLFCLLFLYELKDSRKREHKYQETVSNLIESMEIIRDVKDECGEIKQELRRLKPSKIKETAGSDRVKAVGITAEKIKAAAAMAAASGDGLCG